MFSLSRSDEHETEHQSVVKPWLQVYQPFNGPHRPPHAHLVVHLEADKCGFVNDAQISSIEIKSKGTNQIALMFLRV